MIEAHELRKSFGAVQAVAGVSFTAHDGQVTGLLGPNGAGKTTTLRMLYTLLTPDSGTVTVDGIDGVTYPEGVRRAIGVLPDTRGLYPRLTAREHIRYFGELHGQRGAALEAEIARLIDTLDMRDIADRRVNGFSQGERMKVAIARALVHGPQNILLDEPTNGLDVTATRAMRALITRLREAGKCVIFSSHVMPEVSALCDRIVVIARGVVVADGTPDALRAQTGRENLEEAFVSIVGADAGLVS